MNYAKRNILTIVGVVVAAAWLGLQYNAAQAAAAEAAKEPDKATSMKTEKAAAQQEESKPAPAAGKRSRLYEDARSCLDFPTNLEIIKCAEQYR